MAPRFEVTKILASDGGGPELVAVTDAPELAEVEWRWSGGAYVEYGLPGHPAGVVNVYDYETGSPYLVFTPEALAQHLEELYAEAEAVAGVADEVAHG